MLHYSIPQVVKSVSVDYAGPSARADADGFVSATPIRHYVGWTQQRVPRKRINRHGPAALREVVYLQPGTTQDERTMKRTGVCPTCGEPAGRIPRHTGTGNSLNGDLRELTACCGRPQMAGGRRIAPHFELVRVREPANHRQS